MFEINAVGQNLGSQTREHAESANSHTAGAVDEVAVCNRRVLTQDQFRPSLLLVREVFGLARRVACHPVRFANNRVAPQMHQPQPLAYSERPDR